MSNQYGPKTNLYVTCNNPSCKEEFHVTPSQVKQGRGKFCSKKCMHSCRPKTKYPLKTIQWIVKMSPTMTRPQLAAHLGVGIKAFERAIKQMRSEGHAIPKIDTNLPVGTIKDNTDGTRRIKTAHGWSTLSAPAGHYKGKCKPKTTAVKSPTRTIELVPKFEEPTVHKTVIQLPGGKTVTCDSDKVDATLRYLQKMG